VPVLDHTIVASHERRRPNGSGDELPAARRAAEELGLVVLALPPRPLAWSWRVSRAQSGFVAGGSPVTVVGASSRSDTAPGLQVTRAR
jgi:hypothetical protein